MKFTNLSRTAFAIGAAMFVLVQCGPNPNPNGVTDTGTIAANVLDAKTGQPLPTATVYVGTIVHNIVPSDKGAFTLYNVPIGQQTLTVQAIGYATDQEVIAVTKGQNSLAGDAGNIRMTPTI